MKSLCRAAAAGRFLRGRPPAANPLSLRERGRGRGPAPILIGARVGAAALIVATLAAAASQARAGEVAVACTNPFSGASWRIVIDYDRGTVDSNPARISATVISWRDAKDGWSYTLDRKSGKLTVILASATGGNFLYDHCSLDD